MEYNFESVNTERDLPKKQKITGSKMKKKSQTSATRKSSKKLATKSLNTSTPPDKKAQDWVGRSAVVKFFPTEVSDEERLDEDPISSSLFDFAPDSPKPCNFKPSNKENRSRTSATSAKIDRTTREQTKGGKERVNIDSSIDVGNNHSEQASADWFFAPQIIRHRPTISVMTEPDCFVPKLKLNAKKTIKKKTINKHNCNDEYDVTRNRTKSGGNTAQSYPELSVPLSVISERYQDQIYTPVLPENELYGFGEVYDTNLLHLIHKYLEIDSFHRVVYVGPEKGSIAPQVQKYFCLVNQIQSVYPGKIDYADVKDNTKLLAFKIAHVGAEDFFSQAAKDESYQAAPFHRVILHDAVHYFNDMENTFKNLLKVLHKFGKILIIHRPGSLNTLPYFNSAKSRITENDIPYMKIITSLQKLNADVEWDLVHVPMVIPTSKWMAMLKAKYPPQMEIMSNYEIACGLRELSEGPLKYLQGTEMELEDRLMFITASLPTFDCAYPSVQRIGGASQVPYSGAADSRYYLPITEDLQVFIDKKKSTTNRPKQLF